jgi:hypothetical protein
MRAASLETVSKRSHRVTPGLDSQRVKEHHRIYRFGHGRLVSETTKTLTKRAAGEQPPEFILLALLGSTEAATAFGASVARPADMPHEARDACERCSLRARYEILESLKPYAIDMNLRRSVAAAAANTRCFTDLQRITEYRAGM